LLTPRGWGFGISRGAKKGDSLIDTSDAAFRAAYPYEIALSRGGYLGIDLISGYLHQGFIFLNSFANFFKPFNDGCFLNTFAHGGQGNRGNLIAHI
jgi:hypothetical protein